ncbi:hypothetical protein Tco_0103119 [Tanacetum coccineum]
MVVQDQAEMGEGSVIHTDPHHTPTFIQPQIKQRSRRPKRKDTQVHQSSVPSDNVIDEAVNEEMDTSLVRAATTATSLDAKRVESSDEKGLSGEDDKSNKGRIADIDANKYIYLVNVHTDEDMFGVNDLDGDEVIVDNVDVVETAEETVNVVVTIVSISSTIPVSAATTTTTTTTTVGDVEITLAQALAELKSAKPKADKVVIQEPEQGTTTTTPTTIIFVPKPLQDKGKGIMIEEHVVEQVKPMKRLEQIRLDE